MVAGSVPAVRTGDGSGAAPVAGREMGFAAGDADRPEQAGNDDGFVYETLTAQTGQETTMEAKMPEKWTACSAAVYTGQGSVFTMVSQVAARSLALEHNVAIDQAYVAGLEAGKAQAATPAPAEPAPLVLTDTEKVIWGHVYAAIIGIIDGSIPWFEAHEMACERADTAVLAMRRRCGKPGIAYQGQPNPEIQSAIDAMVAEARVRGIDAKEFVNAVQKSLRGEPTPDAIEAARTEGAKAERERCAGKIRQLIEASKAKRPSEPTTLEHGINVGQQDALKTALDYILSLTK